MWFGRRKTRRVAGYTKGNGTRVSGYDRVDSVTAKPSTPPKRPAVSPAVTTSHAEGERYRDDDYSSFFNPSDWERQSFPPFM